MTENEAQEETEGQIDLQTEVCLYCPNLCIFMCLEFLFLASNTHHNPLEIFMLLCFPDDITCFENVALKVKIPASFTIK